MGKKATEATLTGERAVGMIARATSDMGHLWHPTSGADSGVDGEIELRDPATAQVRNVRIGTQSKGTKGQWSGEDEDGFTFSPSHDDIEYWQSSNQPVIIVCCRPSTDEMYWRSVQEWAQDPAKRATRAIRFDKKRDRFDKTARDRLFDLRATAEDRVEPPGPPAEPETVLGNLMPVTWHLDELHSAALAGVEPRSVFDRMRQAGQYHTGLVLRDGLVWSLRPFADAFLATIGASDRKSSALEVWTESRDPGDRNLVRDLVQRDLISRNGKWLHWHAYKKVAYFRRHREDWQTVKYRWAAGPGRAVVTPQKAKSDGHHTGYRHDAAELAVRRLDGRWHVQISPTYLFTWDGRKLSSHHASALAGIRRLDRHATVSQMLRMWEHLLKETLTLESTGHPFTLGPLVELRAPAGLVDSAWKPVSARDLGRNDGEAPQLFDDDIGLAA